MVGGSRHPGLIVGAVAAVGAAAGFILRGSITTSGTLLVALLGPSVLGSALGGAQRWFTGAAPTALIAHAAGSDRPELGAAAGSIVFTVVVVVVGGWGGAYSPALTTDGVRWSHGDR